MFARLMGLKTISPRRLQQLLEQSTATAVDVNSRQSWLNARVPGAVHLDPVAWQPSDLPADKERTLVFYCSNPLCRKAPNAANRAKSFGYTSVLVMSAGISGWTRAGLPTESGR
jgi:rhodanese-related sulfurtransferase